MKKQDKKVKNTNTINLKKTAKENNLLGYKNNISKKTITRLSVFCALIFAVTFLLSATNFAFKSTTLGQTQSNIINTNSNNIQNCSLPDDSTFLKSPTFLYASNTKLLIFDQSSNSLKQYSQPTAEEKSQWQLSSSTLNLYDFKATSTNCYLLIKESETTTVLAEISPEMSLVTHKFDTQPLISPASQSAMLFATDNSNFYVYRKQSSTIIKYSFENINHKLTYISTINLGDTSPAIESDIKDLTYFDGKLLALTQDNKIYSIATEPDFNGNYITTLLLDYEITNIKSIYSTNDLAQSYMIVNNKITNITNPAENYIVPAEVDCIYILNNIIYATSSQAQKVYKIDKTTKQAEVFFENIVPEPTLLKNDQIVFDTTSTDTILLEKPYNINPLLVIPSGSYVTILDDSLTDNANNYNYILYTQKNADNSITNYYGYISKMYGLASTGNTTCDIELKTELNGTKVYTYPTTKTDEKNIVLKTLDSGQKVQQIYTDKVKNSAGEEFVVVKLSDDSTGYIESSVMSIYTRPTIESINCNAVTKRETKIYASTDENSEVLITLNKNTRIRIDEDFKENKDYTKISYQTPNGLVYKGYVKTSDLNPDGLTQMQILGIVLVVANIIILALIICYYKSTRRKLNKNSAPNPMD